MRLLVGLLLFMNTPGTIAQDVRDENSFAAWRDQNSADVSKFEAHLESLELNSVVELHELLRSASSWKSCDSEPYAIPPTMHWGSVTSVLRLLKELTGKQIITSIVVHSAYRDPVLNKCAGGAPRSAHVRTFAIDFTPKSAEDPTAKLCSFWRTNGRAWNMGFSRYPSGRFHVDTSGYRTWGSDHTAKSSVCKSD